MTIPATNSKLLVTEDWKKIYQSFKNADFQSYDFETLRRTMISYIETNYPEDFNDFIDSSEYIALIDIIAYLGQNLSFRIDLNARENFLETAQRRDSILRLAQLISYVPSRNTAANGFLKIVAISTTDNVIDSNGVNLANSVINWNDSSNTNWYQQFINIFNSTLGGTFAFGKPHDRATINGILTEQYQLNSANSDVPIYSFLQNISGVPMNFEIASASFANTNYIYESPPKPASSFNLIYQNDNQGAGSANTGFFAHFRQGTLAVSSFQITTPVPNEIIGVNSSNINNTDVWLWQTDFNGNYTDLWTKVSDVVGNNVIYNSLSNDVRNIYSVTSRDQDQIDLNFSDGSFGNLPNGVFQLFYRQSNGLSYTINPDQMSNISVNVPYYNKNGQLQTLSLTLALQYVVSNGAGPESNASIQNKAPQSYYLQNRMVTAEDYNIAPLTLGSDIAKVKSINRVSSGISKYFDLSDVSGKYSSTNIFATDGILYKDLYENNFSFTFASKTEIITILKKQLAPIVASASMRSLYMDRYPKPDLSALALTWVQDSKSAGQGSGHFQTYVQTATTPIPQSVGAYSSTNLIYVTPGALIKFQPPSGKYFLPNGSIVSRQSQKTVRYIWATVLQVVGDGYSLASGAITLSTAIDSSAMPVAIIPKFVSVYSSTFYDTLAVLCSNYQNFGLSFDISTRDWNIVADTNIDLKNPFSLTSQNNTENASQDASWLVAFVYTGLGYTVRYRLNDYIFESQQQTSFYFDPNSVNFDYVNNTVIKDQINVLSFNTANSPTLAANTATLGSLGKDYVWQIDNPVIEADGYIQPKKVKVSFYDMNNSGQLSDPDAFNNIVEPLTINAETGYNDKFVYFQYLADGQRYQLVDSEMFVAYPTPDLVPITNSSPMSGDLYYFYDPAYNVVKSYSTSTANINDPWIYEPAYFAYPGRNGLNFRYLHNSGENRRIDPSKSNVIDVYLLTTSYDTAYRNWLATGVGKEPVSPTSQSLENSYSSVLEPIKTISDEMIFHPVTYKVIFGNLADYSLQATFKAVQSASSTMSSNSIRSNILGLIQSFFALQNWDFGQSFYFSELSTYVMNSMTPDITNFVIVPKSGIFGSLYEVACQSSEIFISGATIADIQVIDAVTASQLNLNSIVNSTGQ